MVQSSQLDPAMPPREPLESVAIDVARTSAALAASLPEQTAGAVRDLIRIAETHFSLSIDGHHVHPVHIEQAFRSELSDDPGVRALQRESTAYLKVDRFLTSRLADEPSLDVASPAFLKVLHWELYARVPEEFRWVSDATSPDRKLRVVPGEFRSQSASVGGRPAPESSVVDALIGRFRAHYELARLSPVERIIAVAASHHRLLWIHPFSGGNGRIARLFSAALAQRAGIEGSLGGLWSMSRGIARARARYRELLAAADVRQRNDLDGRDVLSPRALTEFSRFYLETCRDEMAFMRQSLKPETLSERIRQYVGLRAASMAPGGELHTEAASLLREVVLRGEVARGEAGRITGMAPSEARKILSSLAKERLLVSDTPKGPVRLGLPSHAVPYLIPDLFPGEVAFRNQPRSVIEAA